jgi:hypothetical protein
MAPFFEVQCMPCLTSSPEAACRTECALLLQQSSGSIEHDTTPNQVVRPCLHALHAAPFSIEVKALKVAVWLGLPDSSSLTLEVYCGCFIVLVLNSIRDKITKKPFKITHFANILRPSHHSAGLGSGGGLVWLHSLLNFFFTQMNTRCAQLCVPTYCRSRIRGWL